MTVAWPGEQMSLYDAFVKAGGKDPYDDIYYILERTEGPDTATTFVAGDDFYLYSDVAYTLINTDTIGECNWLIDITAGSAVVDVHLSKDPAFSYTEPTWPAAVTRTWETGRQVYPLPMEDRTYGQLSGNEDALAIRIHVVSGSVTVSKAWLQAEPPTGLLEITGWAPGEAITPPLVDQFPSYVYDSLFYRGSISWVLTGTEAGYDNAARYQEAHDAIVYTPGPSTVGGTATSGSFQGSASFSGNSNNVGGGIPPNHNYATACSYSEFSMTCLWTEYPSHRETPNRGIQNRDWVPGGGSGFDWEAGDTETVGWDTENVYIVADADYKESVAATNVFGDHLMDAVATLSGNVLGLTNSMSGTVSPVSPTLNTLYEAYHAVSSLPNTNITLSTSVSWTEMGDPAFGALWSVGAGNSQNFLGSVNWRWCVLNPATGVLTPGRPRLWLQMPDYRLRVPTFAPSADAIIGESTAEPFYGTPSNDTGEYAYEGDVGAGAAPPILWFVYKKWGFLGTSFVAYGQGLGDTQAALSGVLYLGPGIEYPIVADIAPPVTEWTVNAASSHAYDGTGVIFPGTAIAPPIVDVEVQTVEFTVPTSVPLVEPTEFHIYVTNDNGTSNMLTLMLYPMIDIDMESAEPLLMTVTAGMGVFTRPDEDVIEQRYSLITAPYAVTGRLAERPPLFLTDCAPAFELTGGAPSTGLDDPVAVALPMALRYRPLDSKITPRPDLGTGMSVWESNESSSMDLKFNVASAPYVDADNVVSSRNGDLVRPAMVFPGDAWMETTAGFAAGPSFTCVMAVTLYPDPQPRSYILSSFVSGAPDPDSFPLNLYLEGDQLSLVIGAKQQVVRIAPGYIGRRPVIIGISLSSTAMRSAVVSDRATITQVTHPPLTASGLKLYLGRNNDAGNMQIATMDVLDLGIDNVTPAGPDRFWSIINRLDGIYGVMK